MIRSSHWLLWKVVLWAALAALLGARLVGAEIVPASVALCSWDVVVSGPACP